jgi:hypothetical protein
MKFNKIASFSIVLLSILLLISVTQVIASSTYSIDQDAEIDSAINSGFEYLRTQMNDDGGIRWFDENSSAAASLRVVIALASAQYPQDFLISDAGNRPIDFLEERGEAWVNQEDTENPGFSVGRAGQLLTAIAAANENPKAFGKNEANFISEINTLYDVNTGIYGGSTSENVTDQVWAMIGLAANNGAIPVEAADWLAAVQSEDGSWNDGFGSFLDTTPLGI